MTRYLLDTNIISEITKPAPAPQVEHWLGQQADEDLFIASLTVAELRGGILELPDGRKRKALEKWFNGPEGPQTMFQGRILPFDVPAALLWAQLMAAGRRTGRPRNSLDMMIAAVAEAHDCTVATLNARDFQGLRILNPRHLRS